MDRETAWNVCDRNVGENCLPRFLPVTGLVVVRQSLVAFSRADAPLPCWLPPVEPKEGYAEEAPDFDTSRVLRKFPRLLKLRLTCHTGIRTDQEISMSTPACGESRGMDAVVLIAVQFRRKATRNTASVNQ